MTPLMLAAGLLAQTQTAPEGVTLRYGEAPAEPVPVYSETKFGVTLEGTEEALTFARSMHPFMSMESLVVRSEGTRRITRLKRVKFENDASRVEMRYDDEDHEFDWTKGQPPVGEENKLRQMMWFLAAFGKSYRLTPEGEYTADDPNQDHNGEAMDLIAQGITRMPEGPVKEGDTYEVKFTGGRAEKKKNGRFAFVQKVTVEKFGERDGKKTATLTSVLTGRLEGGEKDPGADEAWTKVEGKTRLVLEVESGLVLEAGGQGKVTAYYEGPAQNGGRNTLTMTFRSEGKQRVE